MDNVKSVVDLGSLHLSEAQQSQISTAIQKAVTAELAGIHIDNIKLKPIDETSRATWPWPWLGLVLE